MSFQIGAVLVGTVILSFFSFFWAEKNLQKFGVLSLSLGMLGLFFTIPFSSGLYTLVSPLQFIQFPWRFLGSATMFLAAFSGIVTSSRALGRSPLCRWAIFFTIFVLSILFSIEQRHVGSRSFTNLDTDQTEQLQVATKILANLDIAESYYIEIGGLGIAKEFLPKWATFDLKKRLDATPLILPKLYSQNVSDVEVKGSQMTFHIENDILTTVIVPWFYFPGWQVSINGKPTDVGITKNGFITFQMSAGKNNVSIWFGSTWPRIIGWIIASVSAFVMVGRYLIKCKIRVQ